MKPKSGKTGKDAAGLVGFTTAIRLCLAVCATASAAEAEGKPQDFRPPFDKTPHLKTAWSAANPWFLPNRSRTDGRGGPDFAMHKYPDDAVLMWKQAAEICQPYGLTGINMEIMVKLNGGYANIYKNALKGFELAGNGFMLGCFLTVHGMPTREMMTAHLLSTMEALHPEIKEHPNAYRINGSPVLILYGVTDALSPEDWREVIGAVEARYGHMIWLPDVHGKNAAWVRKWMPVFDGISVYANWTTAGQERLYNDVAPVMKNEFPQKIFEAGIHNTFTVHYWYGGTQPQHTRKYRDSWDASLGHQPDSVQLTNFFDCYENSRILPSYELEDVLLRIAQCRLASWRGEAVPESDVPDLYVSNYINVLLGQPVEVEILGLPLAGPDKVVTVKVELCAEDGAVLHAFPERAMTLDGVKAELFSTDSLPLAAQRSIRPRLSYTWKKHTGTEPYLFPPSLLVTSLRAHLLSWSRSVKRVIRFNEGADTPWTLNDVPPGGTTGVPPRGLGLITSHAVSHGRSGNPRQGGGWVRVLRNFREIESFDKWDLKFTRAVRLPDPGGALDAYNLELENALGGRYLSPTVWLRSDERPGIVTLPVWNGTDTITDVTVEAARVPYFHYRCDRATGRYLLDDSGYEHHGILGGNAYRSHLARTAYRHEHVGNVMSDAGGPDTPRFQRDEAGRGYYLFDGESSFVAIQGGTAFPYASTYELSIRPARDGVREAVLGTPNGQMTIFRTEEGRIEVWRNGAVEGEGGAAPPRRRAVKALSTDAVPKDAWTRIAVTYDLREVTLYLDGTPAARAAVGPNRDHEWLNVLVLGGRGTFPYSAQPSFKGGITNVRIYGRNLQPGEFLQDSRRQAVTITHSDTQEVTR